MMKTAIKRIKPLTYQVQILKELLEKDKAMLHIASGAGKTHTIAFDIKQKKPKSVLYIVHRNEILLQSIRVFKEVLGIDDSQIGIVTKPNFKKWQGKKYLFSTNMALARSNNMEKLPTDIEYLIIDEFHHAAAPTYQKIIEYFKPKYLYGLTATPDRTDLQDIKQIIENNIIGNIDLLTGIKQNILVPFYYKAKFDNVNYDNIEWLGYKYRETDIDKTLLIPKRDKAVIDNYKKEIESENRLTIAFCNSVKHVKRMVEKFNEAGIKSAGITYAEPIDQRERVLEGFRHGHYKVLFARDILNEGVDFPECEALMFLRPTFSKIVFLQQLGRGLRKRIGKKNVKVLDFIGNYKKNYLVRQYLRDIIQQQDKNVGGATNIGSRYKPEYNYDLPIVEFDEEVINIMDIIEAQSHSNEFVTQEQILEYFKDKLPNEPPYPNLRSLEHANGYKYGHSVIQKRFGSYYELLKQLGKIDGTMKQPPYFSMKHFRQMYEKMKEELGGKVPSGKDMDEFYKKGRIPVGSSAIEGVFGTTNKFIEIMGDKPRYKIPVYRKQFTNKWTLKFMIDVYHKKKKELGRIPTLDEMDSLYSGFDRAVLNLCNNSYSNFLTIVEKKDGISRNCAVCTKPFIARFNNANFRKQSTCSFRCKNILPRFKQKNGKFSKCMICGKEYCRYSKVTKGGYVFFCSDECKQVRVKQHAAKSKTAYNRRRYLLKKGLKKEKKKD